MAIKNTRTNWRLSDDRIESLNQIITGFDNAVRSLEKKRVEVGWYDGLWFLEETEPIFGLASNLLPEFLITVLKK